ncbi:MAG TPA: BatD family protein, partial [Polyangiaceae bacterium]|nr:BatD family protein [Polyangiaceae bacterium]
FDLDGRRWLVSKLTNHALFPLKAGSLKIGSMSIGFSGPGYSNSPQGLLRKSAPLTIEVVEPPLKGRPPGYHIGDVGDYTLKAQVEPREVPINGSISVIAKLEGTGNLPFTLLVPEQNGVHFLEPQLVEQIAPRRGKVQGFRTFTYVVELTRPGDIDLGEITLPYYDAKARAYGIARASLGKVKVTGSAPAPAASSGSNAASSGPKLAKLLEPARKMGPNAGARTIYLPSRIGYWLLLFALPLSAVLGFALSDLTRLLRRRLSERRGSLAATLDEALTRLGAATSSGDIAASASAAEKVLFLAIERATGLKARGVLKAELASTLTRHEIPTQLAEQATRLLSRCDELRFAGEALDLPSFGAEVREISQKLGQRKMATNPGGAP